MKLQRATDTIVTWVFLTILLVFWPVVWVLLRLKVWVERYADPTTHSAWVISNWDKFKNDPTVGK